MDNFTDFSFDSAFILLIKVIFAVVSFGVLGFTFLIMRQVQMMNRVLRTQLAPVFVVISLFLLLGAIGLFGLTLLSFLS